MDLVESILRSANAEEYIESFKKNHVEREILSLLTDQDLILLGVDKPEIRKDLLKKTSTLQISMEVPTDRSITKEYATTILNQIAHQSHLHLCCLTCIVNRNDVLVANIKTEKLAECLLNSIESFENEVKHFKAEIPSKSKQWKATKYQKICISVTIISIASLFMGKLIGTWINTS